MKTQKMENVAWTLGDEPLRLRLGTRALVVAAGVVSTLVIWASLLSAMS